MDGNYLDGGDLDKVGKAGQFMRKAFKVINYPHARWKEEQKKYDDFRKSDIGPLERELRAWDAIGKKLDDITVEGNETVKYKQYLPEIKSLAKNTSDKYRKSLISAVDDFEKNGIKNDDLKKTRQDVAELTIHYRDEVSRKSRENSPSTAKRWAWGGATVGVYAGIIYGYARWKFRKPG
jgi:hypothetical protein